MRWPMFWDCLFTSWAIAGVLCSGGASALAQEWATARLERSPRHMEYATVAHGDRALQCFVVYPESPKKSHVVVVIHDISGLGDWIRGVADQLAEAGYIALVPDLLSGAGPGGGGAESFEKIDDARRAIASLPAEQIKDDLHATVAYGLNLPAAKGTASVAGFCWGGGQALRYAMHDERLTASMVFYGYEPIDQDDVANLNCPIYGFYAENDARINASTADVIQLMAAAGKTFEPVTYPGAGHGFMRHGEDPQGTEANQRAREAAWSRWKQLLEDL